ncbi:MAG: CmcI family methyltransferase, partial [Chloroflexota bacterium]
MNILRMLLKWTVEPIFNVGFHFFWYHSPYTWQMNTFLGYKVKQLPFDLHLYQELLFRLKPSFIIQTGVADGGSILYFASILDLMKMPSDVIVVGIDIRLSENSKKIDNPRVHFFEGDSTDPKLIAKLKKLLPSGGGMVVLDSDHNKQHVLKEMEIYKDFVALGSYMV